MQTPSHIRCHMTYPDDHTTVGSGTAALAKVYAGTTALFLTALYRVGHLVGFTLRLSS